MTQRIGDVLGIEPAGGAEPIVRVFGDMGVHVGGLPISIGGPRQRRLLALLTIRAGTVVSIDWLEENLWSDDERPDGATTALRTSVSRLRTTLPEVAQSWIETALGGYQLTAPNDAIEHRRFSLLRTEARRARDRDDPLAALKFLDEALAMWRGQPFSELEDLDWARAETEQLEHDRLQMLEERWEASLALGRHTQITSELAVFTAEHNLRDRAARQYALALHRSGRTVEALRVITDHRSVLVEVGGLEPSTAIIELEASLLSGDPSLQINNVGRPLRGYQLIEEVGSGAFSVVWRALQPSVDREVAIKQIRPELASQPEFIRRFEAEARLVARIEHPHIVPLIDFWRDPDSAYLVMRWLPGGTLERRLDEGPLSVDRALLVARQIGAALTAAHAHGVVHRDVKTANVLFDDDGNAFLADFGIALEAALSAGPEAALSQGSPAYAAPEQIRRQPLGPEADIFSFGIVLFESLAGSLPFPENESLEELVEHQLNDPVPSLSDLRSGLPQSVVDAIATATAKDPSDRFASVEEFVRALEPSAPQTGAGPAGQNNGITTRHVAPTPGADISNPYLGLRSFDDGDADRFFGRESLVNELVRRLGGHAVRSRCVVVVGPSGSGKSSVVRAGLIPALRDGAVPGSSEWFTTTMIPGSDSFESLEAALLRIAVNPPPSLIEQLRDGKRGILRSVRRCLASEDDRVVVVIDQFEEIFTGRSAEDANDFLDALSVAVEDPTSPLRLVVTLRADYYDRPLAHPAFARILSDATVAATPLAADEVERAIVEPARQVGVEFEPGLAARLAAETHGQPSPLPLLQHALRELFDRRVGNQLTLEVHDEIGGVTGALASRAEALFAEANTAQQKAIRSIFGRLTNPGEESADLRRRVPIADLAGEPANAWVTENFGAARLLTFDRDVSTREPTVEVAHEALLREWPRLSEWLADDRDLLRQADEVRTAATAWEQGDRAETDLYRGDRLENATGLALAAPHRLRPLDGEFITASREATESERDHEQRRVRRLRRLVAGTAVALVIALIAGGFAFRQQRRADDEADAAMLSAADAETQADIARTQTITAEAATAQADLATIISRSAAVSTDEPDVSMLLALEAHRRQPGAETEQGVLNALGSSSIPNVVASHPWLLDPFCDLVGGNGQVDFGIADGQLVSVDSLTATVTKLGPAPDSCVFWNPDLDFSRRYIRSQDQTRLTVGPFDGSADIEIEFDEPVWWFSSPRSTHRALVIVGEQRDTIIAIDDTTGEQLSQQTIVENGDLATAALSEDSSLFALSYTIFGPDGVSGEVVILDVDTGEEVIRIETPLPLPWLFFDDATEELIAAEPDGTILTIDVKTGDTLHTVEATAGDFWSIGLRPDGQIIAVSSGQIEILDRQTGPIGRPIELRGLTNARVRSDGLIRTVRTDRQVELIDPAGSGLIDQTYEIVELGGATINSGLAGVAGLDELAAGRAEVIDLATQKRSPVELITPEGDQFQVDRIYPDATGTWAMGAGNAIARWEGDQMVERIDLDGRGINGVRYLDRYGYITVEDDGSRTAQLVNLVPGSLEALLSVSVPKIAAVHPTAEGGLFVIDNDGVLHTYDPDGELLAEVETGVGDPRAIAIDPASGRLAIGGFGVVIVEPATGQVDTIRHVGVAWSVGFAQGGELLAIGSADGTVRIWDIQRSDSAALAWRGSGQRVEIPFQDDPAADSLWVTSAGRLLEIPLEPELWIERACAVVGRDLTQAEWDLFVPGGGPVQSACG